MRYILVCEYKKRIRSDTCRSYVMLHLPTLNPQYLLRSLLGCTVFIGK